MTDRTCAVEDCTKQARSRGWCTMHYSRWQRYGDVSIASKPTEPKPVKACSVEGCGRTPVARGWCSGHVSRWYATGDVRADVPLKEVHAPYGADEQCAIEGCVKPASVKGWCRTHWGRWQRNGDPNIVMFRAIVAPDLSNLGDYIDTSGGPDACHPWMGTVHAEGYGVVKINKKTGTAHVLAWERENGPKPPGTELDHECHNQAVREGRCKPGICEHRLCCNLKHIVLRTSSEHQRVTPGHEMRRKGAGGNRKLTEDRVREMRPLLIAAKDPQEMAEIAARYGISYSQAYKIKRGEAWGWLPDLPDAA